MSLGETRQDFDRSAFTLSREIAAEGQEKLAARMTVRSNNLLKKLDVGQCAIHRKYQRSIVDRVIQEIFFL